MKKFSIILSLLLLGLLCPAFVSFPVNSIDGWNPPTQLTHNIGICRKPSISDDGLKVAFFAMIAYYYQLFVIDSDGSDLIQLTNNNAMNCYPSITGDGSKIAFESSIDGDYEIFVMNSDGTGRTQLTFNTVPDHNPSICSDGSKIAFSSDVDGDSEIFVINSDGTGLLQLTSNAASERNPSISGDGSRIAFESNVNGDYWGIFVINSDGSGLTQLTPTGTNNLGPYISGDGSKITFHASVDFGTEIFVVNFDGTGLTQLTSNSVYDSNPCISSDGSKIAFESRIDDNNQIFTEICIINSDGTGLRRLTSNRVADEYPSISGDGSKIAFESNVDGDHEIFVVGCGWDVTLTATIQTFNDVSEFGVRLDATEMFDIDFDQIDPITPPLGIVSYFYYPDNPSSPINFQKLCASKIAPAAMMAWIYKVTPIGVGGTANIEWNSAQISDIPSDQGIYLICPDNSIIDMRSVTTFTFSAEAETAYTFKIMVGGVDVVLDLDAGWNMVSFPVVPDDPSFSDIFAGVPFYQVISWDGSGYVSSSVVEAGVGYWVLVLEETTITIENAAPVTTYTKNLPAGWNMIGSIYEQTVDADTVFPGFYQLLTWDGTSYVTSTTIELGKGYWALVLEQTTINVGGA